jgi:hypothetical protein
MLWLPVVGNNNPDAAHEDSRSPHGTDVASVAREMIPNGVSKMLADALTSWPLRC